MKSIAIIALLISLLSLGLNYCLYQELDNTNNSIMDTTIAIVGAVKSRIDEVQDSLEERIGTIEQKLDVRP